jgi:transcriptional regulator with XRE-family HTH domain
MVFSSLSDQTVAEALGERLAQLRLERNLTQQQVASEIGLSRLSYRKLEMGEAKLVNFIAALRVLGRVDALELVLPKEPFSPIQLLKLQGKVRKRASGLRSDHTKPGDPRSDGDTNGMDW